MKTMPQDSELSPFYCIIISSASYSPTQEASGTSNYLIGGATYAEREWYGLGQGLKGVYDE